MYVNYGAVVCACTVTCRLGGSLLMRCAHQRLPFHLISSHSLHALMLPAQIVQCSLLKPLLYNCICCHGYSLTYTLFLALIVMFY